MASTPDRGARYRGRDVELDGSVSTLPDARDNLPETRWCRFAAVYCRCGIEPVESATMSACAAHYLHEVSGHE